MSKVPFAALRLAPPAVDLERREDGCLLLSCRYPLTECEPALGHYLRHWAAREPDRTFLAERAPNGSWRPLSYVNVLHAVESVAQALIDRDLDAHHPVMLLSDNGIDHALLQLAAMHVGVPAVPVSPACSIMSQDLARLSYLVDLVTPGLVYASHADRYQRGLALAAGRGAEVVASNGAAEGLSATAFATLTETSPTATVQQRFAGVGPDTVAKILFTSGSTGTPKGVINTQPMLCTNQQAVVQLWPFLADRPPVLLDWLPWSHTFGSNHNFNLILRNGGTLYIDGGKPVPGLIETTVANLQEVSPTLCFNVPRGFDMLLPYLENDPNLRDRFFRDLDVIAYAGAALPPSLWERLENLSIQARGERVFLTSAWGLTETAPMATSVHFPIERAGVIGLPAPGCVLKLVPSGSKLEMRIKGPNVTPGYWKRDDLTQAAFDDEGYFKTGDAGRLADPDDAARGVVFDGRTAENFKLLSGTWVHVGEVRIQVIAAGAPVIQDGVITGHDRDELGLLIFPSPAGCRTLCPDAPTDASLSALTTRQEVRARLIEGLLRHNQANPSNSRRIGRIALLAEPPSIDAGEITDKGYVNQRAVLERRHETVERLYRGEGDDVIVLGSE